MKQFTKKKDRSKQAAGIASGKARKEPSKPAFEKPAPKRKRDEDPLPQLRHSGRATAAA